MKIFRTVGEDDFKWWEAFGWLVFFINLLFIIIGLLAFANTGETGAFELIIPAGAGIIIGILILKYNKYAFLFATIIGSIPLLWIMPLLWIINGIYLLNRWCHPKVNKGKPCGKYLENKVLEKFKERVSQ